MCDVFSTAEERLLSLQRFGIKLGLEQTRELLGRCGDPQNRLRFVLEVIAAMRPFLEEEFGNPSSSHWFGIAPKKAVELSRHRVASLLNCDP